MVEIQILKGGIIKIPEIQDLEYKSIKLFIVYNSEKSESSSYSLAGILKNYAKPELIVKETEIAWSEVVIN